MVYICVICMAKELPLLSLCGEARILLEAVVSPAVDLRLLSHSVLLACGACMKLMETVLSFQKTALVGVKHLLSLPNSQPLTFAGVVGSSGGKTVSITSAGKWTPIQNLSAPTAIGASSNVLVFKDAADPLFVPIKTEPGVPLVDVKVEYESETVKQQLTHEMDIKFEPEEHEANGSASATDSAESDIEDNIPLSTVLKKNALDNCQNQLTHGLTTLQDTPKIATFTHNQKKTHPHECPVYAKPHVEKEPVTPSTLPKIESSAKAMEGQTASSPHDVVDVADRAPSSAVPEVQADGKPAARQTVPQSWYVRVLPDEEVAAARESARAAPEFTEAQYKCHYCLIAFKCETGKALHDKTHHPFVDGRYCCQVCGHRAGEVSAWREHVRAHATRYCCCYCPFSAGDVLAIRQHYCEPKLQQWEKTNFVKGLLQEKVKKPPLPVKCDECYARFADQAKLERHHERLHKKHEGPQVCKVCSKQFRNQTRLYHHMYVHKRQEERSAQLGPRPELFCAVCRLEFPSPKAYRAHRNTRKHGGTTDHWRHECDECGRMFASKSGVRQHIMVVHLKQKNYRCSMCPVRCITAARLRAHVRSHTRPHICHICGKSYTARKSLREHLLAHAGLRPLACALCPATFTYAAARYTHHRLKHLKVKMTWKKRPKKEGKQGSGRTKKNKKATKDQCE